MDVLSKSISLASAQTLGGVCCQTEQSYWMFVPPIKGTTPQLQALRSTRSGDHRLRIQRRLSSRSLFMSSSYLNTGSHWWLFAMMDGGWLELGAVCRVCLRACVVVAVHLVVVCRDSTGLACKDSTVGTNGRAVMITALSGDRLSGPFHRGCKPRQCNPLDLAHLPQEEEQYLMKASLFINTSYHVLSFYLIAFSPTSPNTFDGW